MVCGFEPENCSNSISNFILYLILIVHNYKSSMKLESAETFRSWIFLHFRILFFINVRIMPDIFNWIPYFSLFSLMNLIQITPHQRNVILNPFDVAIPVLIPLLHLRDLSKMVTDSIRKNATNPCLSSSIWFDNLIYFLFSIWQMLHLQNSLCHKQNGMVVHQCGAYELACNAFSLP